jgi:hypothetical protein
MSGSTRLKETLPLIRKMQSQKSFKNSKKKDLRSEMLTLSLKRLRVKH